MTSETAPEPTDPQDNYTKIQESSSDDLEQPVKSQEERQELQDETPNLSDDVTTAADRDVAEGLADDD